MPNGYGKETYFDGAKYEGGYLNGFFTAKENLNFQTATNSKATIKQGELMAKENIFTPMDQYTEVTIWMPSLATVNTCIQMGVFTEGNF